MGSTDESEIHGRNHQIYNGKDEIMTNKNQSTHEQTPIDNQKDEVIAEDDENLSIHGHVHPTPIYNETEVTNTEVTNTYANDLESFANSLIHGLSYISPKNSHSTFGSKDLGGKRTSRVESIRLNNPSSDDVVQDLEKAVEDALDDIPPDGGFGWVVAVGGMLATFATWGANAAYGVFLAHYLSANLFKGGNHTVYALIGGTVVLLAQLLAPISLFLSRLLGPQTVIAAGIVVQTVAYLLASFSTKLWQIFLTQGVLVGLSFSLVFIPATLVLPTWFTTRKATCMGIAISGAGLGGVVFSLAIGKLIDTTGDQRWALRMLCIVCLVCALIGLAVLSPYGSKRKHQEHNDSNNDEQDVRREKPNSTRFTRKSVMDSLRDTCDISIFLKNYDLCLLAAWYAMALLGYVMNLYTLAPYATSMGYTQLQGSTLTAVLNAAQVVGRISVGLIADVCGRYNATGAFNLAVAVLILVYWINAHTFGALVGFSVLLGFTIGTASTMCMPLCHDLLAGGPLEHKQTAAWGGINVIISPFCLVAALIALAMRQNGTSRPYLHAQLLGGFLYVGCTLLMIVIREKLIRKRLQLQLDEIRKTPDGDLESETRLEKELEMSFMGFIKRCLKPMKV